MRLGLIGPGAADEPALREAVEFLLGDVEVDRAIYLGEDPFTVGRLTARWAAEQLKDDGEGDCEERFLRRAARLAVDGSADEIEALLRADAWIERLGRLHKLPPPPARAVEMISDRILLAVYDKAVLDEEDIANAQLIVYGKSKAAELRRFGPRYFLTPGPLSQQRVAVLDLEDDGQVSIALFETSGLPVWRETMSRRTSKMQVVR